MAECNCMIPMLEGAGQHAPGCSVFDTDEDEYGDYGVKNPGWVTVHTCPVHTGTPEPCPECESKIAAGL